MRAKIGPAAFLIPGLLLAAAAAVAGDRPTLREDPASPGEPAAEAPALGLPDQAGYGGGFLVPIVLAAAPGEEEEEAEGELVGYISLGIQSVSVDGDSSKFEEYRDMPNGVVWEDLVLRYTGPSGRRYFHMDGTDVGQQDQRIDFRVGALRSWDLAFSWDRIPHRTSNHSSSIFDQVADNEFRLASEVQALLASAAGDQQAVDAIFGEIAGRYPLRQRQDTYAVHYRWKPHADWDFHAGFEREDQDGYKPLDSQITFFDVNELPELVDYQTHRIEIEAEWANRRGFAHFRLDMSDFESADQVIWDNPFEEEAPRRAWQGAQGLPPDNRAVGLSVSGGINFAGTHRIVGTASLSRWTQDETFLPPTINPAIDVPPLPRDSLDGAIDTTLLDLRYTSRPHPRIGVNAWFRNYRLGNDTDYLILDDVVMTDDFAEGERRGTLPVGYRKTNLGVEAGFDLARRVTLGVGYEMEEWSRSFRETDSTDEDILFLTLDVTAHEKVAFRLRGDLGKRRYDDYDPVKVLHFMHPDEDLDRLEGQVSPDQRIFDQADRDHQAVEATLGWFPIDSLTLGARYSYEESDYPDSVLGLQAERYNGFSLDLAWVPLARLRVYGNWARETYNWDTHQRYRRNSSADDPLDDWSSHDRDEVTTWGLGFQASLVPRRLEWTLDFLRADAEGSLRNDWVPGGQSAADDIEDFPPFANDLKHLNTTFTVLFDGGWEVRAGYLYEKWEPLDYKIDPMQPYMSELDPSGGSDYSSFMAATVPGYRADVFSVLAGYRW